MTQDGISLGTFINRLLMWLSGTSLILPSLRVILSTHIALRSSDTSDVDDIVWGLLSVQLQATLDAFSDDFLGDFGDRKTY